MMKEPAISRESILRYACELFELRVEKRTYSQSPPQFFLIKSVGAEQKIIGASFKEYIARNEYERFLVENTLSEWVTDEQGRSFFIERGNNLTIAESGQPDEQQADPTLLGMFGSW